MGKKINVWYAGIFFIIYMAVCFLMPSLLIKDIPKYKEEKELNQSANIKLLLKETNEVIEISFEDYIKGVLIGEMPISYELEALKAQAVVARTYTLYKLKNSPSSHENGADMCDDINCCQAYNTKEYAFRCWDDESENSKWEKLESAVNDTSGEFITYDGNIINAFFHSNSGGKTENVKFLWSKEEIPYLISVDGMEQDLYMDSKSFTKEELKNILISSGTNYDENTKIEIIDYTGSGRVNDIKIGEQTLPATKLRSILGIRSTNFRIEENENTITFYTVGYGHGVGMSQMGANQMALNGYNYQDIIRHYYTGVLIERSAFNGTND